MTRHFFASSILSIISTSLIYSSAPTDSDQEFYDQEATEDRLIVQTDSSTGEKQQDTPFDRSTRTLPQTPWRILCDGDFLYWKAEQQGLEFGLQTTNFTTNPPLPNPNPSKGVDGFLSNLKSHYHSGYRLSLSFEHPHDDWEIYTVWTEYDNRQHRTVHVKDNEVVFPDFLDGNFFPLARGAKAHWKLDFNTLELNLGRGFYAGNRFSLKPFAGFKAAWINQTLDVNYQQISYTFAFTSQEIKTHNRSTMQGYGIDGGIATQWDLFWGFYLFGTGSVALLWSEFDIAQFSKEVENVPRIRLKQTIREVIPQLGLTGGLAWHKQFYDNRLYLNIHTGWEEQIWFDTNQLYRYVDTFAQGKTIQTKGNLSMYGWTIGASIGF